MKCWNQYLIVFFFIFKPSQNEDASGTSRPIKLWQTDDGRINSQTYQPTDFTDGLQGSNGIYTSNDTDNWLVYFYRKGWLQSLQSTIQGNTLHHPCTAWHQRQSLIHDRFYHFRREAISTLCIIWNIAVLKIKDVYN